MRRHLTSFDRRAIEQAEARGLTLTPYGRAWLLHGKGVDVLVDRPSRLSLADMVPVSAALRRMAWRRWYGLE